MTVGVEGGIAGRDMTASGQDGSVSVRPVTCHRLGNKDVIVREGLNPVCAQVKQCCGDLTHHSCTVGE